MLRLVANMKLFSLLKYFFYKHFQFCNHLLDHRSKIVQIGFEDNSEIDREEIYAVFGQIEYNLGQEV